MLFPTRWQYSHSIVKHVVQVCAACNEPFLGLLFADQIITHQNVVAPYVGVCSDYCGECSKTHGIYAG